MKSLLVRALSVGIAATLVVGGVVLSSAPANAAATTTDGSGVSLFTAAAVFYNRVEVSGHGGCRFTGNGGGFFLSGAGHLVGTLKTLDARLLTTTKSYYVVATPVYVYVAFFDSNSNQLGEVHTGGIGSVSGVGGGTGSWSC